jgi:hypothetical protein
MRVSVIILALCVSVTACANHQFTQDVKAKKAGITAAGDQCKTEMLADPELDPIRKKVELYKPPTEGPPQFEIASNDTFPTNEERPLISKWATMRDSCIKRQMALLVAPSSGNAQQTLVFQQEVSFAKDTNARISELIVALYQQKLTYGEFAQKRYWLSNEAVSAERAYRQSVIDRDEQRQLQAQQQFANTLTIWGNYMQAVNARQPQTVYINGTIRVH